MKNWKQKYMNGIKSNPSNSINFLTSNDEIQSTQEYQQILQNYLQKHIVLVNHHRNQQILQLQKLKEQMHKRIKHINHKSKRESYIRQYDLALKKQQQIQIVNPSIKTLGKTKSFHTQIDECTQLIKDLKRRSIQKQNRYQNTNSIRQNQINNGVIFPPFKSNNELNYNQHNTQQDNEQVFQSKLNKININTRLSLSNSLNHANLRNYRNRYYHNQSWNIDNPIQIESKSLEIMSPKHSPNKEFHISNFRHAQSNQKYKQPPKRIKQLLNLYKLETEVSEDQIVTPSAKSKNKSFVYRYKQQNKKPINFKQKQKELDQLYSAKIKGAKFCQKIKQFKARKQFINY